MSKQSTAAPQNPEARAPISREETKQNAESSTIGEYGLERSTFRKGITPVEKPKTNRSVTLAKEPATTITKAAESSPADLKVPKEEAKRVVKLVPEESD